MDEPFSALDPKTRESLQLFLKEIWKDFRMTILFVTHDLEEALILGTRLVSLGANQSSSANGSKVLIDRDISDPCIQATLDAERRNKLRGIPEEIRRLATDPNMDDGV
jgi:NitT/TauT family transport system ATP-binding protein